MTITNIVKGINEDLAGELLTYSDLNKFMDQVIDDINDALDTKFPVFSDFTYENYPDNYPDYNFFPDKYIRNVVIKGAAYKFYIMDEEGIQTAGQYQTDYADALFKMTRDYLEDVPEEYQAQHYASVKDLDDVAWKDPWIGSTTL